MKFCQNFFKNLKVFAWFIMFLLPKCLDSISIYKNNQSKLCTHIDIDTAKKVNESDIKTKKDLISIYIDKTNEKRSLKKSHTMTDKNSIVELRCFFPCLEGAYTIIVNSY